MKPSTARNLRRLAQVRQERLLHQLDRDRAATRPTAAQEGIMDPHSERIDRHLEDLAQADAADAAWQERLMEIGNLAYCVTRYDLETGKLHASQTER